MSFFFWLSAKIGFLALTAKKRDPVNEVEATTSDNV